MTSDGVCVIECPSTSIKIVQGRGRFHKPQSDSIGSFHHVTRRLQSPAQLKTLKATEWAHDQEWLCHSAGGTLWIASDLTLDCRTGHLRLLKLQEWHGAIQTSRPVEMYEATLSIVLFRHISRFCGAQLFDYMTSVKFVEYDSVSRDDILRWDDTLGDPWSCL